MQVKINKLLRYKLKKNIKMQVENNNTVVRCQYRRITQCSDESAKNNKMLRQKCRRIIER